MISPLQYCDPMTLLQNCIMIEVDEPVCGSHVQGVNLHMTHELPISHPFNGQEIDRVLSLANSTALCEYYLDIQAVAPRIQALLDKLKTFGDEVTFGTIPCGDMHLQVSGFQGVVGAEFQRLQVVPPGILHSFKLEKKQ